MTDYFLDSVGGDNTDGSTWPKAYTSWSSLVGGVTLTASDRVIIGNNHVENFTTTQTITTNGAMLISSTTDAGSTITYTPAAAGKQFNWSSGTINISLDAPTTGYSQVWGVSIQVGLDFNPQNLIMHDCQIELGKDSGAANVAMAGTGNWVTMYNCDIAMKFTSGSAAVIQCSSQTFVYMHGGSISTDATADNTNHEVVQLANAVVILDGVDINGFARDNFLDIDAGSGYFKAINCRLNTATTDTYSGAAISNDADEVRGYNISLDNTTSSNTVLSRFIEDPFGKASTDTSIYLDASDGTTSYSDKVVTSALCSEFFEFFRYEMAQGFADFSTNKTLTVNFAQDGTATNLKDSEIWMEVQYPTSGNSSYSYVDDKASDNQTTANQTTNSESWTGLGGTNTKQQLSVTTSSGKEGPYKVFIYVSKPSTTVYIDPKVNVT